MRTSILLSFLLLILTNIAFAASVDSQFEPKSSVKPPLHEVTPPPPVKKTVAPKPVVIKPAKPMHKKSAIVVKPVPLEVKRVQAKLYKTPHKTTTHPVVVKHHPHLVVRHCQYHAKPKRKSKKNKIVSAYRRHRHLATAVVYPGSLRWNVERIAHRFGWGRVVWNLSDDYRWVGKTRISAHGVTGIFEKLLKSYPVQADFYQGNHVLVITPRTLQ